MSTTAKLNDKNLKDGELLYKNIGGYRMLGKTDNPEDINESYLDDYAKWDATEGKKKRIADYRRFAEIDEDFVITEDNIDEWALRNTCAVNYDYPRDKVLTELLETKEK